MPGGEGPQVSIAESFVAPAALHALVLPGDALAGFRGQACRVWVVAKAGSDWRVGTLHVGPSVVPEAALAFPAFDNPGEALFHLFVTDADATGPGMPDVLRARLPAGRLPICLGTCIEPVPTLPALPPRGVWAVEGDAVRSSVGAPALRLVSDLGTHWRDQFGGYAAGWLHCGGSQVLAASLALNDRLTPLALHPRPDVVAHYPECEDAVPVGFAGYVAGGAGVPLDVVVETAQGASRHRLAVPERLRTLPPASLTAPASQERFVAEVNAGRLRVLELGARVVGPEAVDWRARMPGAAAYVGLDVHPSPHVDLVGDAHRLGELVAPGSFDAIWSAEVLEHLQMPWLVAAEVNRALRLGGLTFHMAPHTWPLHEMPADYWRFSDQALRVLFGPAFGFEVLQAELVEPVAVHPRRRDGSWVEMPVFPGYGHAAVLSRKVAELPAAAEMEAWARAWLVDATGLYPKADRAERERAIQDADRSGTGRGGSA